MDKVGSITGAILPDGRLGRNANLFPSDLCERLQIERIYRQNISLLSHREWTEQIGRRIEFSYEISGWFEQRSNLSVNLMELDQKGNILRHICKRETNTTLPFNGNQNCTLQTWLLFIGSPQLNVDRDHIIDEKLKTSNQTSTIAIDIDLGKRGSCRDFYISIETA